MPRNEASLQALTGGVILKRRVQHPSVHERTDRGTHYWHFRYYADEIQPDGSVKTVRKFYTIGPSRGEGAIGKRQAEIERDKFLAKLNAPTPEAAVEQALATGIALFGEIAKMYEEGYLGRERRISKRTRVKEKFYLDTYLVPRWGKFRLNEIKPKAVEDWLHTTFEAWWTMHGVRAIMSRVFYYAEGHGLWEEGKRSPASKAKLGKKRHSYERRILSFDETARVLSRIEEPYKLIIETCIATGTRISEVLGLKWKHLNLDAATIKVEQRVWHQDVGRPKSEESRRILGIGDLAARFREKAAGDDARREAWAFHQKRAPEKPLWDSGVRNALHQAAQAEGCDFPGLGPHSFRRANITWRQEVGGSAVEASKIAGHADLEMTGEYTFVAPERQNELTRRIQDKLAKAANKAMSPPPETAPHGPAAPEALLDGLQPATDVVQ
ncbi:MAG: tyrosine-type recombinase/integrase [Bryobacterales bacterium]|nr:tyrosine-type recombinase/integrase [Bryobacterales bacterium]